MKFTEGYWLRSERANGLFATQAYAVDKIPGGMRIVAPTGAINHRGDTLNMPTITIEFKACAAGTISVRAWHYEGYDNHLPQYEKHEELIEPEVQITDDEAFLDAGAVQVRVDRKNFRYSFEADGKMLTSCGFRNLGYMRWDRQPSTMLPEANYLTERHEPYMVTELSLGVGECVYGLGERFTAFVKNGQSVDTWNEDGGTASQIAYKSIPFYMTNRGYGVFVDSSDNVSFEVASEKVEYVGFSVPGEQLSYYFFYGPTPKQILKNYTALTGLPALPPAWSFGLWLSTSFTTNYDEETTSSFINGMIDRGIPLSVFHFDCFWMKGFHWCDFEWDKDCFPDIKGTLQRYHEKGLKICAWINPYIAQGTSFFKEGAKHGYLLQRADGKGVWQTDNWQAGMGLVDFTNPNAVKWYTDKLRTVLDSGVDCFKTDFGERIPVNVVYYDGSDPHAMHNYYTYLYNKAVFNLLKEVKGEKEAVLFARSATAGGQQFPVHWGGDCFSNYESMWETLRGGLSLCMSGFGYFSHDISGFEAQGTPDLYKRWCAFGLMSSHSRLHGNSSYRVPWNFDEESCDVLRHWTKLKGKLMPYLWTQAHKTHATGVPMMRAMVMEYADDPATLSLDRQYMLGDNLLVAPVFNEEGIADFYVPAGNWTDIQSGRVYEGGKWYSTKNNYFEMPVLAKPNSIVAYGNFERAFTYAYGDKADIVIYQLEDGKSAETTIYDADSSVVLTVKAVRSGDTIKVTAEGTAKDYTIRSAEGLKVEF